jgi:dTMP kinase
VFGLPIPRVRDGRRRIEVTGTFRDIREGFRYVGREPRVRGVMVGLGLGLIGGGAMIPLGPVFAKEALGGDSATFGVLMSALGFGAAGGVMALLVIQRRVGHHHVFELAVMGTGAFLVLAACCSSLFPAALAVGLVGACAGTSYVTGFTALQETVHDELRGRTFAMLYTVIRLCLLLSLVVSPLWADFWHWILATELSVTHATAGGVSYSLPGVRIALWGGGLTTLAGGWFALHAVRRAVAAPANESRIAPGAAA